MYELEKAGAVSRATTAISAAESGAVVAGAFCLRANLRLQFRDAMLRALEVCQDAAACIKLFTHICRDSWSCAPANQELSLGLAPDNACAHLSIRLAEITCKAGAAHTSLPAELSKLSTREKVLDAALASSYSAGLVKFFSTVPSCQAPNLLNGNVGMLDVGLADACDGVHGTCVSVNALSLAGSKLEISPGMRHGSTNYTTQQWQVALSDAKAMLALYPDPVLLFRDGRRDAREFLSSQGWTVV
jgi:hypothetical protein